MPELTTESYYVCEKEVNHTRYGGTQLCDWHEFTHDERVVEKDGKHQCPKCGGDVEVERWAV